MCRASHLSMAVTKSQQISNKCCSWWLSHWCAQSATTPTVYLKGGLLLSVNNLNKVDIKTKEQLHRKGLVCALNKSSRAGHTQGTVEYGPALSCLNTANTPLAEHPPGQKRALRFQGWRMDSQVVLCVSGDEDSKSMAQATCKLIKTSGPGVTE